MFDNESIDDESFDNKVPWDDNEFLLYEVPFDNESFEDIKTLEAIEVLLLEDNESFDAIESCETIETFEVNTIKSWFDVIEFESFDIESFNDTINLDSITFAIDNVVNTSSELFEVEVDVDARWSVAKLLDDVVTKSYLFSFPTTINGNSDWHISPHGLSKYVDSKAACTIGCWAWIMLNGNGM